MHGGGNKRVRTDGQLSKDEYEATQQGSQLQPGSFARADAATMATRQTLTAHSQEGKLRREFNRQVRNVNASIAKWVDEELSSDPDADLTAGLKDYVGYIAQMEERYRRKVGVVLTFGNGDCGQLAHGIEDEDKQVKWPRVVRSLNNVPIVMIACGGLHNAVSTADGRVYTWGCNDDGSLGRITNNEMEEQHPAEVPIEGEVIVQVSAGDCQTFAVALSGNVYGWGCYKDKEGKQWFEVGVGAGGISACKRAQRTPQRVPGLADVCEIRCGASFNVALRQDGRVFSWGLGETGELGRPVCELKNQDDSYNYQGIVKDHLSVGRMIPENSPNGQLEMIKGIGAGSYHCFLITATNARVLAVGLNNYGQLGLGDTKNRSSLAHVTALDGWDITAITGGTHHSLAISSCASGGTGTVYAFGRADAGQLGTSDSIGEPGAMEVLPVEVKLPGGANENAIRVAAGSYHSLCLASEKGKTELYTWGCGDMLALGHGNDKDQARPKKIDVQKAGFRALQIFDFDGGGQHTAIVGEATQA